MNKVKINDTTIRDIFQNIELDYININKYRKLFEILDTCGFDSIEAWGGASFEALLDNNFSKNPWDYLKELKEIMVRTPLQASIGAKNLTGFDYFSDEIIKKFINLSVKAGISKFRVFDALNDINNMKFTLNEIVSSGAKCEGTIIFEKTKPVDFYINFIEELFKAGCTSICIKDSESVLTPSEIKKYFSLISSESKLPLFISIRDLKNMQVVNYLEAVKAGFTGIDLSLIPSDFCQAGSPSVFPFLISLNGLDFDTDINIEIINKVFEHIRKKIMPLIKKQDRIPTFLLTDKNLSIPPRWLISAILKQLQEIGEADRFGEIIIEMQDIKSKSGNPTFSSPIGHIIAGQAILNKIFSADKWEMISDEMIALLKGLYGRISEPVSSELINKIISTGTDEKIFLNKISYERCQKEMAGFSEKEEDILSYCFFPDKTLKLFDKKSGKKSSSDTVLEIQNHIVDGEDNMSVFKDSDIEKLKQIMNLLDHSNLEEITLEKDDIKIKLCKSSGKIKDSLKNNKNTEKTDLSDNQISISPDLQESKADSSSLISEKKDNKSLIEIKSPIVGTFYSAPGPQEKPFVKIGQKVQKGDVLCIVEAMKLMNKITSEFEGVIEEILVSNEEPVEFDKTLMKIRISK